MTTGPRRGCLGCASPPNGPSRSSTKTERWRPVDCDIDRAMVQRVPSTSPGVVRRKDATDEGDYRDAMSPIVADRVDIPPGVAAGINRLVEARSRITRSAA